MAWNKLQIRKENEFEFRKTRKIEIIVMTDGDPFGPKYATVYADPELEITKAKELAFELFGRHTTVTEIVSETRYQVHKKES